MQDTINARTIVSQFLADYNRNAQDQHQASPSREVLDEAAKELAKFAATRKVPVEYVFVYAGHATNDGLHMREITDGRDNTPMGSLDVFQRIVAKAQYA